MQHYLFLINCLFLQRNTAAASAALAQSIFIQSNPMWINGRRYSSLPVSFTTSHSHISTVSLNVGRSFLCSYDVTRSKRGHRRPSSVIVVRQLFTIHKYHSRFDLSTSSWAWLCTRFGRQPAKHVTFPATARLLSSFRLDLLAAQVIWGL